ncbi:MAG: GNAT family N-acetyltransferase [Ktedonobacterales bacterium]
MRIRHAIPGDIPAIVAISARVQAKLTASGSLQQFGPLPVERVAAHVTAKTAYVLDSGAGHILGGVFVAPATSESHPVMRGWGLADHPGATYFLEKLMIEPEEQGHSLGYLLLEGARSLVLAAPGDTIILDCWAGNDTLRAFYTRAGFHLHGIFPAGTPPGAFAVAVFTHCLEHAPNEREHGE